MNEYLFFLGSHPKLSAREVTTTLRRMGLAFELVTQTSGWLLVRLDSELQQRMQGQLGGVERIAKVRQRRGTLWSAIEVANLLSPTLHKFRLGFSGWSVSLSYMEEMAINLKKLFLENGIKMRFVLPRGNRTALNAAQVLFNGLYRKPHHELLFIKNDREFILAVTLSVQDIEAYEKRDTARPARDPKVGMLPPKLAQIMLNLIPELPETPTILDPFCGMGTVLQEGLLLKYNMIGSDTSSRMVAATLENLGALFNLDEVNLTLGVHDAQQPFDMDFQEVVDAVVTEPFLGKPITTPLSDDQFNEKTRELGRLYINAFTQFRAVLKPGGYVMFVLPAYVTLGRSDHEQYGLLPSPIVDEITKLGYSPLTDRGELMYARPQALIARELSLWQKI